MSTFLKRTLGCVLLVAGLVVGISLGLWYLREPDPRFDSEVWRDHLESGDETLTDQGDAIVAERAFDGKTREEVIAVLGQPTFEEDDRIGYALGPDRRPFGVDREWLTLWFGMDGRVNDYHRWRD